MNKALLAIVIIAVGIGAGWYYFKGTTILSKPKPTTQEAQITPTITESVTPDGAAVVSYTDSGFSPKTITVKKGTAVTFKNDSTSKMWVASGVHPTHQLLPGFDELTSVVNGGSYEYTFVKVGTWQYHNHLKPTDVAVVVVVE